MKNKVYKLLISGILSAVMVIELAMPVFATPITESTQIEEPSKEIEAETETSTEDPGFGLGNLDIVEDEEPVIVGFVKNESIRLEEKLALSEVLELIGEELQVYLEGVEEAQTINVTWGCVEDYDNTDLPVYHFEPAINGYRIADEVEGSPILVVAIGDASTNNAEPKDVPGTLISSGNANDAGTARWFAYDTDKDGVEDYVLVFGTGVITKCFYKFSRSYDYFNYGTGIRTVVIENGITEIGDGVFNGYQDAKSVTIPESVTSIGKEAFQGCMFLEQIVIPSKVTKIGHHAFAGCEHMRSVTLPEGLTKIEESTFTSCYLLSRIKLPNSLTTIGKNAFDGAGLVSINIPCNVQVIDDDAFNGNKKLSEVTFDKSNASIHIGKGAFAYDTALRSISLPNSVLELKDSAFKKCTNLEYALVPPSVSIVGVYIFSGCPKVVINCYDSSEILKYAKKDKIPYKILGQSVQIEFDTFNKYPSPFSFSVNENPAGKIGTRTVTRSYAVGEKYGFLPPVEPIEGIVFGGWYTEHSGGGVKITEDTVVGSSKITLYPGTGSKKDMPFIDVPSGAYYYDAVKWAYNNNITTGVSATEFGPSKECSRGQIVTFQWRAAGQPSPKQTTCPFTDVVAGTYYYNPVLWAVENKITTGTSATTFSPKGNVSRGQVVTFIWRANGSPEAPASGKFIDVPANAYYAKAVNWCVANGITTGTGANTFSPTKDCVRGQIVTFLYRGYAKK